jgi:DNA topoisomerase-1
MTELSDEASFFIRKRRGKGFQYFNSANRKITGARQLKRIKALVIPPMWEDVLIAREPNAKIQVSGRDAKGRKQYIYSEQWQRDQQAIKFSKLPSFADGLPALRTLCHKLLKQPEWTPDKVLALMALILDHTGIRIGNKYYAKNNQTYGLSTLRRKHLIEHDQGITLQFTGKSGKQRAISIDDDVLATQISQASEQTGYSIFRYRVDASHWADVSSDEVNEFIRAHMGDDFSCKDFRTWTGTCLAVKCYCEMVSANKAQRGSKGAKQLSEVQKSKKIVTQVVKSVSKELGNTPAICREYYIHPKVLEAIAKGSVNTAQVCSENFDASQVGLSAAEREVLYLIEC